MLIFEHSNPFPLKDESDSSTQVTLSLAQSPAGAVLTCDGGTTRRASSGHVEWEGCSVDKVGDYLLRATASGLPMATGYLWVAVARSGQVDVDGEPLTLWTMSRGLAARFMFEASGQHEYQIVVQSTRVKDANVELLFPEHVFPFIEFDVVTGSAPIALSGYSGALLEAGMYHVEIHGHTEVGEFTVRIISVKR